MMQVVPTQSIPSQNVQCQLGGQAVTIDIYQQAYGLFVDVYVAAELIIAGVLAENLNRIVRNSYLGLLGDFAFLDTQGTSNPVYTELGTRYLLLFFPVGDAALPAE